MSTATELWGIRKTSELRALFPKVLGKSLKEVRDIVSKYKVAKYKRETLRKVNVKSSAEKKEDTAPLFSFAATSSGEGEKDIPSKTVSTCATMSESRTSTATFDLGSENKSPEESSENLWEIKFYMDEKTHALYEEAKSLVRPKGGGRPCAEDIFSQALECLLEKKSPKRKAIRRVKRIKAKTKVKASNKKSSSTSKSRYIAAEVREEVYLRDGCQCTFVSVGGRRCSQTEGLEIDHITPFSKGGENDSSNLRLLCKSHNLHMAKKEFGADFVESFYRK